MIKDYIRYINENVELTGEMDISARFSNGFKEYIDNFLKDLKNQLEGKEVYVKATFPRRDNHRRIAS